MRVFAARPFSRLSVHFATCVAASLVVASHCQAATAERPSSMKLFPEETAVFVRVANGRDLGERIQQTSMGRMLQDPQLKVFVDGLYGKASEVYAKEAESKLGISWEDLKKLPKGEVAFGIVTRPERRPALLLLVDQGDEPSVADRLIDRALEIAQERGGEVTKEKIGDVEVTIVRDKDRENRMFGVFERDNTIVVATDSNILRNVLYHWDHPLGAADAPATGEAASAAAADQPADEQSKKEAAEFVPGRTLAENAHFATIVQQCRRPQDPPPQLVYYIDPISLIRNTGRNNGGLQFVLGLFPALGVDGLQAIGGATTYATDEYDSLTQLHILLENPRSGVMQLPAFQACDAIPQPFVPLAVENYLTWNWNLRTTYDRIIALVDQYRYQGSVDKFVKEKLSDQLGIDFPTQVIDNLKGRMTWMMGYERPSHFRGQQNVLAAELNDENAAQESLKTVIAKFPDFFEERHFGSVTYYAMGPKAFRERDTTDENAPIPTPCVAITDGYIFIGSSCQRFEQCIAARDGTIERLADSNDFARTSAVIGRETRGVTPVLFAMNRMEETVRQWYDLLTSEKTRSTIDEHKEGNVYLTALAEAMDQNKLPPFDTLLQYMAPGGGIIYDTDSGYHAISFTLRNEVKQ